MKLLVIETTFFVDGERTADFGRLLKFVTDDESYLEKDKKWFQYGTEIDENDLNGAEDSSNTTAEYYEVREISDVEAVSITSIIELYEAL